MSTPSARAEQPSAASDGKLPYPEDTVFMVPDVPYELNVIRGYLNKKYRGVPKDMIVSQINMHVMPHIEKMSIVVVVRKGVDGNPPGPAYHVVPDDRGILREKPVAPETYHNEVVESPAVRVRDHIPMTRASMFQQVEPNLLPLIDVLCDHAWPFRITPQNKPDSMLRCVVVA